MDRKRIAILGAGISGLSAGWYLKQSYPDVEFFLLEKSGRAGGLIHTDHTTGFHFEKGPRTFKVNKAPSIMRLCAELDLHKEIIWSEARPHHRYIWHDGELHRFPTNPLAFFLSPLTKGFVRALLSEWKQPSKKGDETVWEFVLRRFNYDVARRFFDPLVIGIFGGDIRKISIKACFPVLKAWEEQFGSITKGFLHHRREKKKQSTFSMDIPHVPLSAMFALRSGMESLSQTLVSKLGVPIFYEHAVQGVNQTEQGIQILTDKQEFSADALICALPAKETGRLFEADFPEMAKELLSVYSQGIAVVSAGYESSVLPVEGFGYLTATHANEDILGVIFDSSVFPQHNRLDSETRLTIKIEEKGHSEEEYAQMALKGLRRHLGISKLPDKLHCKKVARAIPQYRVGHLDKMQELDQQFREKFPHCYLAGNYIDGVSVDACIARSRKVIQEQLC